MARYYTFSVTEKKIKLKKLQHLNDMNQHVQNDKQHRLRWFSAFCERFIDESLFE